MGFAEKRGNYKIALGQHDTVVHENGKGEVQPTAAENRHQRGGWHDPVRGQETFGAYANRWYEAQDLAASTMQNYRRHIKEHLLPNFEDMALASILRTDVDLWEKKERAVYAISSVKTWRSTLHVILEDAIDEGLITSNPAARRRGRGKRAGRSRGRGPEKVITDPLGILLIAERAALLSGRDDEFVAVVLKGYTGMRWGEIVGLEREFARLGSIRVEWQLYELDTGELVRCPPKDDSYRTLDEMDWLSDLVANHIARTKPTPCPCHGKTYVFRGRACPALIASRAQSSSTSRAVPTSPRAQSPTSSITPTASPKPSGSEWRRPSRTWGSYGAAQGPSTLPTGAETASRPGYSPRRSPAGTRRRHRSRPAPYRFSASRGPGSRPEDAAPVNEPKHAGSRSPRASHPTAFATPTGL